MQERLMELEIRVAYQDKLIADLDEVVGAFATRVEHLERDLNDLRSNLADNPLPIGPADEPPPHY